MNGIYSLRALTEACRYDVRMLNLLRGKKAPGHERFGDFIRKRLTGEVMENLFYQLVTKLLERGCISFANLFVDGTKIETNANRYSFVWEKAVMKHEEKMHAQIDMVLLNMQTRYAFFETPMTLEGMQTHLKSKWEKQELERISRKGHRKSELQKDIECLEEYQKRQEKYFQDKRVLKGRPSYSKTDHDASFMRMKEEHMKNGQLKPGYNLQFGVEGEFIVTAGLFSERSDTLTLLPLLRRLKEKTENCLLVLLPILATRVKRIIPAFRRWELRHTSSRQITKRTRRKNTNQIASGLKICRIPWKLIVLHVLLVINCLCL